MFMGRTRRMYGIMMTVTMNMMVMMMTMKHGNNEDLLYMIHHGHQCISGFIT